MSPRYDCRPHGPAGLAPPTADSPAAPERPAADGADAPTARRQQAARIDAYTEAVPLTRRLFQAFQTSPATLARRQGHPARPDAPGRKSPQDS